MKLTTFISALGLLLTLGAAAYLDSPYSFLNINYTYTADQPVVAKPAAIQPSEDEPELVEKLEKSEKDGGYIVETYQEYEIYKDKEGNIKEEIPTSRTDTLKYWDYSGASHAIEQ